MARSLYARALADVALVVTVAACSSTAAVSSPLPSEVASPVAAASILPATPSPSVTPEPGYGSAPPDWPSPPPFAPASALPDPSGDPIPASMVDREYNVDPPDTMRTQALVLTLRASDDPHCAALYDGRSTCFTILWTPNYPKANDPAVRGAARIVHDDLVLSFDYVPYDTDCQGSTSTYAISPDGWTLTGKDVPGCSFQAFARH